MGHTRTMADTDIQQHISELIAEEHELRERVSSGAISPSDEQGRLRRLETELDRCWDLLRARRARREYGEDPDQAQARDASIVEGYQQ